MNSVKFRAALYVVISVIILSLSTCSAAAASTSIYGDWECIVETEDVEDFVYSLHFSEQDDVIYVAGWYQSEITNIYVGQFTIEGDDVLKLEMADTETSDESNKNMPYLWLSFRRQK